MQSLDQFEFHHVLEETPGTSLVVFTAPGCGACKAMRQALLQLGEREPSLNLFEVDAQRDLALAREHEVFHLPSLFLYREGRFHSPLECEPLPGRIAEAVVAQLARPPQEAP